MAGEVSARGQRGTERKIFQIAASVNRESVVKLKVGGISGEQLKQIVARIERLEEEKAALAGDIREVYGEAKSAGFDVKVLRQLIRLRKLDAAELNEREALLDVYRRAVGMAAAAE